MRSALDHISPDVSYDDWLRHRHGAAPLGPAGRAFSLGRLERSRREVRGREEPSLKWDGFTSGGGVTLGTLFDMAKKAGWEPPMHERHALPTDEEIAAFMDIDPAALLDQVKPGKKRDVLECLIEAGTPLAPKEIAERLGRDQNATRVLLHRMVKDGQLVKDENDHYTQCPNVTAAPTETITSEPQCNAESNGNHYIEAGCNARVMPPLHSDVMVQTSRACPQSLSNASCGMRQATPGPWFTPPIIHPSSFRELAASCAWPIPTVCR
ncbi:MAG: helix-turn-helix domain-containing protein [Gammaproteobacteria bacterium]|nr:helix-turn-helix domain-containing protein [Gammaproteobacteria bacterium]